jgi:hypothetical protein
MTEPLFKTKLHEMLRIINLSPARQSQIYFDIIVSLSKQSITLIPTTKYFDSSKSKFIEDLRLRESEFHIGLAVGGLEVWLKENNISYEREDIFKTDEFITVRMK